MNVPTRELLAHDVSLALLTLTGAKPTHVSVVASFNPCGYVVLVTFTPGDEATATLDPVDLDALNFIQRNAVCLSRWAVEQIASKAVLSLIWHTSPEYRRRHPQLGGK